MKLTNTQKPERLKEIEKEIKKINLYVKETGNCLCDGAKYRRAKFKQEANNIGEEFKDGCGKALWVEDNYGYTPYCGIDGHLCPTCQEIKEILGRINNE